jgi:hypothetical protein
VSARRLLQRFRRRPRPMGDHTLDFTAEDIINPWPRVVVPPEITQLGAWLSGFSPERRRVFEEAVSANGFPAWVHKRVEDFGGWEPFQRVCVEALHYLDLGVPAEASLLCSLEGE